MKPQSLEVDVAGICSVSHKCNGCIGRARCCCAAYEITVSARELESIVGAMPLAARFCPGLRSKGSYRNVFERIAKDVYAIDKDDKGVCAFAYFEGGRIACSLHAAATRSGLSVKTIKPEVCLLWPLAVSEGKSRLLSVSDDAFDFGCNRPRPAGAALCPSLADIVETVFGLGFRQQLQAAAAQRRDWTSISLRASRA